MPITFNICTPGPWVKDLGFLQVSSKFETGIKGLVKFQAGILQGFEEFSAGI